MRIHSFLDNLNISSKNNCDTLTQCVGFLHILARYGSRDPNEPIIAVSSRFCINHKYYFTLKPKERWDITANYIMNKILYIGCVLLTLAGCQLKNEPSASELTTDFVNITLHFQNLLPADLHYIFISMEDEKLDGGIQVEDGFRAWIHPENIQGDSVKFRLNATPRYYNMPYINGRYNIKIITKTSQYQSDIPELHFNEIDKYTSLVYQLKNIDILTESATYELVYYKKR